MWGNVGATWGYLVGLLSQRSIQAEAGVRNEVEDCRDDGLGALQRDLGLLLYLGAQGAHYLLTSCMYCPLLIRIARLQEPISG